MSCVIAYLMIDVYTNEEKEKKTTLSFFFLLCYWEADNRTSVCISENNKDRDINDITRQKSIIFCRSIWLLLKYLVDLFLMHFTNVIVILIQHLMILKMDVISSFLLVHHRKKQVDKHTNK